MTKSTRRFSPKWHLRPGVEVEWPILNDAEYLSWLLACYRDRLEAVALFELARMAELARREIRKMAKEDPAP